MREVPELVLVAVDEPMASAWDTVAAERPWVRVHRGSVTDLEVDAVVSPANSYGYMRGGIDGVYARWLPGIEQRVRAAIAAEHGGELPVGAAMVVPTGAPPPLPAWLISAPTMRRPGERLGPDGDAAGRAARAVVSVWRDGVLPDGRAARDVIGSLALPGLGTGVGGLAPHVCAARVSEAITALD
ncbi:macro domain-containing protein [Pseudonocardia acaciae]|uniref:macro domain-containing protein n=1 Tax=Pseudonocardia acaciae TaxID=551276 RepID=UPI0005649FCE|nr:macro domain-containing protein [Pseudonocardia acaciae]